MTYRLDEIKDFLMNEDEGLNEDLYDKLYDLFCSEWSSQVTLSLPEFKINEKTYSEKTFKFTREAKKVLDDYCEGKTEYHYEVKLTDQITGDKYKVYTYYYNDDMTGMEIVYLKPKKEKSKTDINKCCDNVNLISISGKCNDMFSYKNMNDDKWKEGSPFELNLGNSDYIEFTYCKSCSKIHFK